MSIGHLTLRNIEYWVSNSEYWTFNKNRTFIIERWTLNIEH